MPLPKYIYIYFVSQKWLSYINENIFDTLRPIFHFLKLPQNIASFSLKLHSSVWIISVLPLCWLWSLPTCFWWENHRILKLWLPIVALKSPLNFGHALHVGHCLGPTHLEMRLPAKLKIIINAISNHKVQLFWECHQNLLNLSHGFDIYLVKTMRKIAQIFVTS